MASNYTEHYNLCQWEATDQVLRTEFNEDNAKIDGALKSVEDSKADQEDLDALGHSVQEIQANLTKIVVGNYTGDGEATRIIPLSGTPKAVLLMTNSGITFINDQVHGGLALQGAPLKTNLGSATAMQPVTNGFEVYDSAVNGEWRLTNRKSEQYHYIAFI